MLSHRSLILLFFFFHLAFWMVFWLESKIWHKWTFYKTKQIPRHRTDLRLWGGGRGREGLARLGLADANCYIRDGWTMRHRELCSVSCDDPQWKRTCICITESPCRTAEINHNIVNQPYLNMRGTKRIKFVHSFLTKKRPFNAKTVHGLSCCSLNPPIDAWASRVGFIYKSAHRTWVLAKQSYLCPQPWTILVPYILSWPNSSFELFHTILWKNPNELFGQSNIWFQLVLFLDTKLGNWLQIISSKELKGTET